MKRCIGYAGLLLLMMGWPMNVEAGPRTTTSVSGTRARSVRGLMPDAVHARLLHEESRRVGPVKHHQVGGLSGSNGFQRRPSRRAGLLVTVEIASATEHGTVNISVCRPVSSPWFEPAR